MANDGPSCSFDARRLSTSPKRNILGCRGDELLGIPRLATDGIRIAFLTATKALPVGVQQMIWQEVAYNSIPACPPPTPKKQKGNVPRSSP